MIEPIPTDNAGGNPGEVRELSVDAETYEAGRADLYAQVPDGWRILNFRRA